MRLLLILMSLLLSGCAHQRDSNRDELVLSDLLVMSADIREPLPNDSKLWRTLSRLAQSEKDEIITLDGYHIDQIYVRKRKDGAVSQISLSVAMDPCFSWSRAVRLTGTNESHSAHHSRQKTAAALSHGALISILGSAHGLCLITLNVSP